MRMKKFMPTLYSQRLRLRPLEYSDGAAITRLLRERDIALTAANMPYPFSEADARAWIADTHTSAHLGSAYIFGIIQQRDDIFTGAIGLDLHGAHYRGEVGYWIGKPYWGQGFASEALRRVLQFGFEELDSNRIEANCYDYNIASARVMEKAGMIYEGTLRQYLFNELTKTFENVRFYGILKSDYHARN